MLPYEIEPQFHLATVQKIKFSVKDFFNKCDQILKKTVDLVTFTEEILNGKLHICPSCVSRYHV